jgi:hypothetical protein
MTLGNAAAARVRLIAFGGRHQVEPDPAEMATRYGAETTVARAAGLLGVWRSGMLICRERDEAVSLTCRPGVTMED